MQKEKTQRAKLTLEIENLTHERRSKELVKHYLTSLAIEEILLLRLAETLSVIAFSAKSYYSQSKMGGLTHAGGDKTQYNWGSFVWQYVSKP